jgi:hypothetical protein
MVCPETSVPVSERDTWAPLVGPFEARGAMKVWARTCREEAAGGTLARPLITSVSNTCLSQGTERGRQRGALPLAAPPLWRPPRRAARSLCAAVARQLVQL